MVLLQWWMNCYAQRESWVCVWLQQYEFIQIKSNTAAIKNEEINRNSTNSSAWNMFVRCRDSSSVVSDYSYHGNCKNFEKSTWSHAFQYYFHGIEVWAHPFEILRETAKVGHFCPQPGSRVKRLLAFILFLPWSCVRMFFTRFFLLVSCSENEKNHCSIHINESRTNYRMTPAKTRQKRENNNEISSLFRYGGRNILIYSYAIEIVLKLIWMVNRQRRHRRRQRMKLTCISGVSPNTFFASIVYFFCVLVSFNEDVSRS